MDARILTRPMYIEAAWNTPVSLRQVVDDRLNRRQGMPTMIDYAFFGTHANEIYELLCQVYRVRPIHHELTVAGGIVEVLPCSWHMSLEEVIERVQELREQGVEVCLVPEHGICVS